MTFIEIKKKIYKENPESIILSNALYSKIVNEFLSYNNTTYENSYNGFVGKLFGVPIFTYEELEKEDIIFI